MAVVDGVMVVVDGMEKKKRNEDIVILHPWHSPILYPFYSFFYVLPSYFAYLTSIGIILCDLTAYASLGFQVDVSFISLLDCVGPKITGHD
jgi:hypothetical protein